MPKHIVAEYNEHIIFVALCYSDPVIDPIT